MELLIEAGQLEPLLGLRPKVFLSAADATEDGTIPGVTGVGTPLPFEVWLFTPGKAMEPARLRMWDSSSIGEQKWITLAQPPAAPCVCGARSSNAVADLDIFRSWWEANGPVPAPAVLQFPEIGRTSSIDLPAPELLLQLLQTVMNEWTNGAEQQTGLAAQLYALRGEYDQARVALEKMNDLLERQRYGPPAIALALYPNGQTYTPPSQGGALIQNLEVLAEGLAGFDLHFPPAPGVCSAAGYFRITLDTVETGDRLGIWQVPASHLGSGWVRCWFPKALASDAYHLRIRLEWIGRPSPVPTLSLANVNDWDELNARIEGGPAINGALAVMVWTCMPGLPLRAGPTWCTNIGVDGIEFELGRPDFKRLVPWVLSTAPQADWKNFHLLPGSGFRLHPVGNVAATALLSAGCPSGVARVNALVQISHPDAPSDVQFAMLATRVDQAAGLFCLDDPGSDPRTLAFSGWLEVPPDQQPHLLTMNFPRPLVEEAHVVFATRVALGDTVSSCWADWLEVRMQSHGIRVQNALAQEREPNLRISA